MLSLPAALRDRVPATELVCATIAVRCPRSTCPPPPSTEISPAASRPSSRCDATTIVRVGALDYRAVFLLLGLALAVLLLRKQNPFAFLASIFAVTAVSWGFGFAEPPTQMTSAPDFSSTLPKLDIVGALQPALVPAIVAVLFTDLFDSLSTFMGVASAAGLTEPDGRPLNLRRGLIVVALATLGSGLAGTSSATAFVESIAGIRVGARTGRASIITALCFLPCVFVAPLAAAVPGYATAPVLVLVGL